MARNKKRSKQPSQVPPLGERHYKAIRLLATPERRRQRLTRAEIARKVGVSRMTLYRWEQREDFQREVDKQIRKNIRPHRMTDVEMYGLLAGNTKTLRKYLQAVDML